MIFFNYVQIQILLTFFLFNIQINLILLFLLFVQNRFTKTNILNIYASGLLLNFNEIKSVVDKLTKMLILYFIVNSLETI